MTTTNTEESTPTTPKRRGRRGGRRRKKKPTETVTNVVEILQEAAEAIQANEASSEPATAVEPSEAPTDDQTGTSSEAPSAERAKRRRRGRRGGRGRRRDTAPVDSNGQGVTEEDTTPSTPEKRKPGQDEAKPLQPKKRYMMINVAEGEESRIAVLQDGLLEELFMERHSNGSHVGNIYKGIITNVEPSIQAAFVDFGLPKNGFLHISDLQPQYFPNRKNQPEQVGRKTPRRDRPPIQKCLRRGQEVIVQVIKEGIGTKGPTLTTYISIPGRYLVMMPGMNKVGVSRKIEDEDARRKMRKVLDELDLPKDRGYILRTAGMDRTKRDLQRDLTYLERLWKVVVDRVRSEPSPCELYQESDLVVRTIRDVYSSDFDGLIVDDEEAAQKIRDFLSIAMPRSGASVQVYRGTSPLFYQYDIESQIDGINDSYVPLPSGGYLVIDSTEALVAIDVNSGRFREHDDAEENAYRINLEAAEEIARQLRLRDLGGLILCDFIDMRFDTHRRGVEKAIRDSLKKHKERAQCLRTSQFGIIEMTRQRMRPSIKRGLFRDCPHCRGSGLLKTPESLTLDIMRLLRVAAFHDKVVRVEIRAPLEVATDLQNRKRTALHLLGQKSKCKITIFPDPRIGLDQFRFDCYDARDALIPVIKPREPARTPAEERKARQEARDKPAQSEDELPLEDIFENM